MIPLYIFDLDGTLANIEHRRAFVQKPLGVVPDWKPRWKEFYAACVLDAPNMPVIYTMSSLIVARAEIWIFSGRSKEVEEQTLNWLKMHTYFHEQERGEGRKPRLLMRHETDFTPDEVLKRKWLHEMSKEDRARLVGVFDDRDKVVKMWREEGVTCFQVAPGAF